MPELPEVETIIREMREANLEGRTIEKAHIFWERSIAVPSPSAFCKKIARQKILHINRRGKFLVFTLSEDTLLIHLRMTGKFLIAKKTDPITHSHERVRLYLDDGRILRYEDQRKFGKWNLVSNPQEYLNQLGIEPLSVDFTLTAFKALLKGHQRQIKPFLLDQHFVAGLGNIYVDEALWVAKIHPLRRVSTLTQKETEALHNAIPLVLQNGIKNTGTSLGAARANYFSISGRRGTNQNQLNVFRKDGLPCPRCQTIIQKITVGQRGSHFCPTCQVF
ncbi:DNA-formamidopyrimidine glycosylase [Parachlamydia sp. AcF125]|uniref:DNA-formamidopyrimidine glycosylase n=1 Tax=Parachlamydia sp. AcF125 TaxID=2795736 RepID=UPI001BC9F081|nr:DNA-formamidopyrimidine glycosylase [Parachlamydia sp. AcF125]MBS4169196.1 Formamidopyrimidine-DNA glycosylase [Parachlamydia sp. AcF125]